jgi:hypothetical protein
LNSTIPENPIKVEVTLPNMDSSSNSDLLELMKFLFPVSFSKEIKQVK